MNLRRTARTTAALLVAATTLALAAGPRAGAKAPDFTLTGVDGKPVHLADLKGKYVVLEWTNHGCPFVKRQYDTGAMQAAQHQAVTKGAVWLSICSSAPGKQGFMSPADWKKTNADLKVNATAVLIDSDGKVGRLYGARTTPHMFVIDPSGTIVYEGAIDDKPTTDAAEAQGAKNYVLAALDQSIAGRPVATPATESYGCSIKYQ